MIPTYIATRLRAASVALSFLVAALLSLAAVSHAGIHYTQSQSVVDEDKGKTLSEMKVEGWVDGMDAKVLFVEALKNPMLKDGKYLLTNDGGKTVYLVDPKEETYMEWDLEAMLGTVGDVMESMGGMVQIEFDNPQVEQLESRSGGTHLGFDTQYRKFRTTYVLKTKIMGMKQEQQVENVQEIWGSPLSGHEALGIWLRSSPPKTNIAGLDEMIEAESSKMESIGYPFKSVTRSQTVKLGRKGKEKGRTTTVSRSEVDLWEQTDISKETFVLPDYELVAMPLVGEIPPEEGTDGEEEPESKKKRSLRGLFKRN